MKKILFLLFFFIGISIASNVKAETATYYFNSYDTGQAWEDTASAMTDSSESTTAYTQYDFVTHFCNGNSYSSGGSGEITKVEIQVKAYAYYTAMTFTPVFDDVDGESYAIPQGGNETVYRDPVDITDDTSAPATWSWSDIASLKLKAISGDVDPGEKWQGIAYIKLIVTYESEPEPEPPVYDHMAFFTVASTTASSTEIYFADFFLDIFNYLAQLFLILFGVIILLLVLFITLKVWE